MSSNSQLFAAQVLKAFEDAGLGTDAEIGAAGGPSTTTLTKLRKAAQGDGMAEPRGDTYGRIDRAANWRSGSARALWREGAEPVTNTPTTMADLQNPRYDIKNLEARITELEERARLLEATLGAVRNAVVHSSDPGTMLAILQGSAVVHEPVDTEVEEFWVPGSRKTPDVADSSTSYWESERQAARKGQSVGRQLRTEQDAAGEDSQDVDAHDPA